MADASATLSVTVYRNRLAGRLSGKLYAGGYVGVGLTCNDGAWPAATYVLGLAADGTAATTTLARTATTLSGTLNLNTDAINDLWTNNATFPRRAILYLVDRTPRTWMAQPVTVEYVEDQSYG